MGGREGGCKEAGERFWSWQEKCIIIYSGGICLWKTLQYQILRLHHKNKYWDEAVPSYLILINTQEHACLLYKLERIFYCHITLLLLEVPLVYLLRSWNELAHKSKLYMIWFCFHITYWQAWVQVISRWTLKVSISRSIDLKSPRNLNLELVAIIAITWPPWP